MTDKSLLEERGVYFELKDKENAVAIIEDFEKFLKKYPDVVRVKSRPIHTDDKKLNIIDIQSDDKQLLDKYLVLEKLSKIIETLSIDREQSRGYFCYELFYTNKKIVCASIDINHLKRINEKLINALDDFLHEFSKNTPDRKLKEQFLIKAIEDVFAQKRITFNDIIDNWSDLCEEFALIQRAYIESLDAQKLKFDYEKKVQELNDKIHNILNDIQTKLIIPPLALLLVYANIHDKPFLVKCLSFGVVLILTFLISFYSYAQYNFLIESENSVKRWKELYKKSMKKGYFRLENQFTTLLDLVENVKATIKISNFLFWISLYIIGVFLFQK